MRAAVGSIVDIQEIIVGLDTEAGKNQKKTRIKTKTVFWSFDCQIEQNTGLLIH